MSRKTLRRLLMLCSGLALAAVASAFFATLGPSAGSEAALPRADISALARNSFLMVSAETGKPTADGVLRGDQVMIVRGPDGVEQGDSFVLLKRHSRFF